MGENRLRQAREYVGFSLEEVRAFMGWTPWTVAAVETGEASVANDEWVKLSRRGLAKRVVPQAGHLAFRHRWQITVAGRALLEASDV